MIRTQFLNYVLDTKDSELITKNGITEDYFEGLEDEFNFIKEHLDRYGIVPDKSVFFEVFPNFTLINVQESPQYLLDALVEKRILLLTMHSYNKIKTFTMKNQVDEVVQEVNELVERISGVKHIESVDILRDTEPRYDAYLDKANEFKNYYVSTGFKELDAIIGGWDRQEEYATIAARTNQGKSWLLIKMAAAAVEEGLRVGFYSGEMSENKVAYRLDTQLAGISNTALTKGNLSYQMKYRNYLSELPNKYPNAVFKVLTPTQLGRSAGVSDLRAFIEKENLDILFVDQHSLLEDDKKAKNLFERAGNISKDLKNLQVLKKIPIITASQQNRTSTDNGVGTEHIAQSDRIAQDSTVILFFEQNKEQSMITFHLVKSRDSVHMKDLKYAFDFDKGTYTYIPEGDDVSTSDDLDGCSADYRSPEMDMAVF